MIDKDKLLSLVDIVNSIDTNSDNDDSYKKHDDWILESSSWKCLISVIEFEILKSQYNYLNDEQMDKVFYKDLSVYVADYILFKKMIKALKSSNIK